MDLDRAQAEWTLERFPYPQLPELAARMMMQGFEGPAILELVSFHRPGRWDVPPDLVDRAFQETGREPLSRAEAAWVLARPLARDLLTGSVGPVEGATLLVRSAPWGGEPAQVRIFCRLDELVELWHRDSDLADRGRYERLMVETVWEFLER